MITRRQFMGGLLGLGAGGALELWRRDTPFPDACRVRRFRIPGPAGWAGRRVVFVTDTHYGFHFGPAEAAVLNAAVRAERPDLVAMGGDLAETPDTDLGGFFSHWAPGCPTVFAPGNHDIGRGGRGTVLEQARRAGWIVLSNQREAWDGLTVVGLPSALQERQDLRLLRGQGMKLVLAHEPDRWDLFTEPDLVQLAGHTHGGQIRLLGRALCLPELGRKYPLGRFTAGTGRNLLVSAGIGCVEIHARLNCPPELVALDFA